MKLKTKILAAVAMTAFALSASAAEVYSSNTVGYTKLQLNPGYNMIGVQFLNVGGTDKDLSNVFTLDSSFEGYDSDYNFKNTMRVWNGSSYTTYGWSGNSGTLEGYPEVDNLWLDSGANIVTGESLKVSDGVWVCADKAGTLTIAGEIVQDNMTIQLKAGYNIVCNPYPHEVSIKDFGVLDSSFEGYDSDYNFKNTMRVWNGSSYTTYGWSGNSGTLEDYPEVDNLWLDSGANIATGTIGVGQAVWICVDKAGTITFQSPITK